MVSGNLAEKMMQAEQLKKQSEAASEQLQLVMKTLLEMTAAKDALLEISKSPEGSETLVPLGAGVYIKSKITDNSKIFMGLGAETVSEKGIPECLKILDEQIGKVEEAREKLSETIDQINDALRVLVPELEKLAQAEEGNPGGFMRFPETPAKGG